MLFKASAPGSLMLLGEHAVLHGSFALVTAINYRMHVRLLPHVDTNIEIESVMGKFSCELKNIIPQAPYEFVLAIFKKYQNQFPSGFSFQAHSEFSHQIGFGSSAAITVATLRVIHAWLGIQASSEELIKEARDIVRSVQGIGSGADVAASVLGGVVAYSAEDFFAEKIAYDYPITVVYSGAKTKTAEVIRYVQEKFKNNLSEYKKIIHEIGECAKNGMVAAKKNHHAALGEIMNQQQNWMTALQVNCNLLQIAMAAIAKDKNILGTKISGSGLGDCAVGLGEALTLDLPEKMVRYPCKIEVCGASLEKN